MNLIDEQYGPPLAQPELILRLLDHLSHFIGGRAGGGQRDKTSCPLLFTAAGNDVSQSGLKHNTLHTKSFDLNTGCALF